MYCLTMSIRITLKYTHLVSLKRQHQQLFALLSSFDQVVDLQNKPTKRKIHIKGNCMAKVKSLFFQKKKIII